MAWLNVYGLLLYLSNPTFCSASEFTLPGDYLLGGFFSLNKVFPGFRQTYPVSLDCHRYSFDESSYQMFQMMRFAVEEINNSSILLPNITLGYRIFNRCSDTQNFPSVLNLLSQNRSVPVLRSFNLYHPSVVAVAGLYESTRSITVAPFFMMDLIPMVSYGSTCSQLSQKQLYPSFLRTVPSNKALIEIIIHMIKWFRWNWVAFIGSRDDYSEDGLQLFSQSIRKHNICLGFQALLTESSDYKSTLSTINKLQIKVIVVFSIVEVAKALIQTAIKENIQEKVWIASEGWSMNSQIPHEPGIQKIGYVIGITEKLISFPGFDDFVYKTRLKEDESSANQSTPLQNQWCNQECDNCTNLSSEKILSESPTYLFPVYATVYTMAYALNKVLQCEVTGCRKNAVVYPYMLLKEMKKLNFSLHGRQVKYDENGDPPVSYDIVFWRLDASPPVFERVGSYVTHPKTTFSINNSLIGWKSDNLVPFANCSTECGTGFKRQRSSNGNCCFSCEVCPENTYVNSTEDIYACVSCGVDNWSEKGSTSCSTRSIKYLQRTNPINVLLMVLVACLIALCIAVIILFYLNANTPVVKSSGGNMCYLMLTSLALSSGSILCFFGQPTPVSCILRNVVFYFFYTVCLSCMTVRSFQIVCVFKMAAMFPRVYQLWQRHSGQWLVIAVCVVFQAVFLLVWVTFKTPRPVRNMNLKGMIILGCSHENFESLIASAFIWFLSVPCFTFSYMGTDLPKNYNDAKPITFSMLLLYITWCIYFTISLINEDVYIQMLNAGAQLSSLYTFLLTYFIPKVYIIVFQPKKNTQAYFQNSIQNYTQTISRM